MAKLKFTRDTAKAWATETIRDFYMCPVTPMTADFKFDEAGIRHNIDAFVDMGVNGLVMGGFIAECWNVTLSEWMRYHRIVADHAKGRIPLWSIVLDPSVHQAVEKMKFLEEIGFDGAEVINPVVQLRTDNEVFAWFKYLTDNTDLAICLYRTPVSGLVLNWNLMERLADIPTVVAVKQGSMNRAETIKLRSILRKDFMVSEPFEYFYLDDLRIGGQCVWGELSYMLYGKKRHLAKEYIALGRAGRWEEARVKWDGLQEVRDFYNDVFIWEVVKTATYASALGNIKAWFEAIGLKSGPVIPPIANLTPARKEEIASHLKKIGVA